MSEYPTRRIVGVLLAAGRGRRMGALKQLLPWTDDRTVVECAFDTIAAYCGAGMIVVLDEGNDGDRIKEMLAPRQFTRASGASDSDMFESVRAGLRAVDSKAVTHVLLHTADHPCVSNDVIASITSHPAGHNKAIIPTFAGAGGHPVCFPANLIGAIENWNGGGGLRHFWIENGERVERVEFANAPEVTRDLDHPSDYESHRPRRATH